MLVGAAAAAVWMLLVSFLATTPQAYVWLSLVAAVVAGLIAVALARFGDRGVATGVAMTTALGLAVALAFALVQWVSTGRPW